MLQLISVPLHYRELVDRFIRVPWFIHREHWRNECWVPPLMMERREFLDPRENPFFEHADCAFWIAVEEGRDVGRIAAIQDRDYDKAHGEGTGFFGMFECIDDPRVAEKLLDKAKEWLKERGIERAIGPMSMSMHQSFGVLIDNFDRRPSFDMPYNPPYYPALIEGQAFEKAKDVYQWGIDPQNPIPARVTRIAEKIAVREGLRLRPFDMDDWDAEVERCLSLYNDAWKDNWGHVALSLEEFRYMAKHMKTVLHPRMGLFVEAKGEAVAVAVSIRDLNPILQKLDGKLLPFGGLRLGWELFARKNRMQGGRLIILGIREDYRRRGLDALLIHETHKAGAELGIREGQIGWTLEENRLINRAIENQGGEKIGTYRLYEATI